MLWRHGLAAITVLAILARVALMVPRLDRELDDPDNYLPLAQALATGRGFVWNGHPTAYRPPLYPLMLAPLVAALGSNLVWGVFGLHLALGVGTVALTVIAARRWGWSGPRRLLAAAIVALDPVLVVQARAVMTETLAACLLAATLAALASPAPNGLRGSIFGGLGFGVAALCRPSLLPAAGLTAVAALLTGPGAWRVRLARMVLLVGTTAAALAPWAWRNERALGQPIVTTTHGGYTLVLANNPIYYAEVLHGPPGAVWSGPNQRRWFDWVNSATAGLPEPEADRFLWRAGWRILAERPVDFLRAGRARLGRFWGLAPSGSVYPFWLRAASAAWTAPLWLALAIGLARRDLWRWPRVAAPMVLLALTAVHALFWTDQRMRAPLVPAIALIASGASWPRSRRGPQ
jgi:4-amino-4-deoxy-L-arabinose transferase-like glycosyltransferase